jgi:dolichol-phosphate mannosyltransferase
MSQFSDHRALIQGTGPQAANPGQEETSQSILVVLPAFDEEIALGRLLPAIVETLAGNPFRVIVVDDGSRDRTAAVVEELGLLKDNPLPLDLVRHPMNLGLGKAINSGLRAASNQARAGDVIVTMDADNTHPPGLIPAMVRGINSGKDVVIASRYTAGGQEIGLSKLRHTLSKGSGFLLRTFFPLEGVRDYTCGYRAYRAGLVKQALDAYGDRFVEEGGFTCMAEILIKLAALRPLAFSEVPLILRYDLKPTKTKIKITRTIGRYFVLVGKLYWRKLTH